MHTAHTYNAYTQYIHTTSHIRSHLDRGWLLGVSNVDCESDSCFHVDAYAASHQLVHDLHIDCHFQSFACIRLAYKSLVNVKTALACKRVVLTAVLTQYHSIDAVIDSMPHCSHNNIARVSCVLVSRACRTCLCRLGRLSCTRWLLHISL